MRWEDGPKVQGQGRPPATLVIYYHTPCGLFVAKKWWYSFS